MKIVLNSLGNLSWVKNDAVDIDPEDGFMQAEVLACAVCRTDAKMWQQGHRDLVLPRVLGHEMVVQDAAGQRYVVWPGNNCGICRYCQSGQENLCNDMQISGFHTDGGFAKSVVLPQKSLIPIADKLDNHIGCFAEPVGCIVNAFEKLAYTAGDKVLIYGGGTMGLLTALYAGYLGLKPVVIEKNAAKIEHVAPFLAATGIACVKDTAESEFAVVINCCADFIAFCQGITKVSKGGRVSFFSGLTKNEHIETNLLNLIHYKEAYVSGAYGMKKGDIRKGVPFLLSHGSSLRLLIEEVVAPARVPELMPNVLSGNMLKYILDFSLTGASPVVASSRDKKKEITTLDHLPDEQLSRQVISAIEPLSNQLLSAAIAKIDNKTKPLGALGKLEALAVQMSQIQNTLNPAIATKQLCVFAADHGVTEEGVSAYPADVTAQMVENFLNGGAAINVLCHHHGIAISIVDMGVNYDFAPHPDLIDKKVAKGTRNFAIDDAMSKAQMVTALEHGMEVFLTTAAATQVDIVGLGEMGIGNTTSATAIISAITGISPSQAAGRGTGIDDKGLEHKIEVIERVLQFHQLDPANGLEILQKIGGFEIAGITGAVLAAASKQCAVVLDGVISTAAGLIAYLINPDISGYLIAGHKSVERSQQAALAYMGLEPLIDLEMRLGEGTGAALTIDMADAACKIMSEMASFDEAKVARSTL